MAFSLALPGLFLGRGQAAHVPRASAAKRAFEHGKLHSYSHTGKSEVANITA
jgi:hypothetical protein